MFDTDIYVRRRDRLKTKMRSGLVLFIGNEPSPMNGPENSYPFRQDSSFLYFFGLDMAGLAALIDIDSGVDMIFGNDVADEDIIWTGLLPKLKERAFLAGIEETAPLEHLETRVLQAINRGREIHYLPPYRTETMIRIERLLGIHHTAVKHQASKTLIESVVELRSVKGEEEIVEIEKALQITRDIQITAMRMAKPGVHEREVAGRMEGIVRSRGCLMAFDSILTTDGHILHNPHHVNILEEGRLVLNDSGSESPLHYASDITRTFPAGERFTQKQREIYEVVLRAQETARRVIKPGVKFRDIHLETARVISGGLKDIGLMKGDVDEAVHAGAHALFFPHGLGHMMGLDAHDMEDLGEDYVGYDDDIKRSDQFGLARLRLAKALKTGYVLTVEPGIYFIPALIEKWAAQKKCRAFINYARLQGYLDLGGIRIEDDIVVTKNGHRVIGPAIPRTVEELETISAGGSPV